MSPPGDDAAPAAVSPAATAHAATAAALDGAPPASTALAWRLHTRLAPDLNLQQTHALDALLVWDMLSEFARHGGPQALDHWRVLLELASPPEGDAMPAWCGLPEAQAQQALLHSRLAPSFARAPHSAIHTALLPHSLLPALLAGVRAGALLRFELGAPCAAPAEVQAMAAWPDSRARGPLRTLGVIDDGCCLAHAHFRRPDGSSRLLALWDQDPAAQPDGSWQHFKSRLAPPCAYGVELHRSSLQAVLAQHPGLGEAHERRVYTALGRPHWGAPQHRHGARVMQLLAGPPPAAPQALATDPDPDQAEHDARRMPLIFVQLPRATYADTSGNSLGLHVVDGARYIVERTRASANDDNAWSTTVCISLGSVAGPHDGSSMAELALDQLASDARVRIVVAAGNSANGRLHAQQQVHQDAPGEFWLRLPADKAQDTLVQLWLPADQPAERFQLQLQGPGMPVSPLLRMGHAATLAAPGGLPVAGVVWAQKVAQGQRGHLVLVALAATSATSSTWSSPASTTVASPAPEQPRPRAQPGLWRISLSAAGQAPAEVHAWVERDDQLVGMRRPQQARFEPGLPVAVAPVGQRGNAQASADGAKATNATSPASPGTTAGAPDADHGATLSNSHTLASLANGQRCTVAAAYVHSTRRLAKSSAQGPRRGVPWDARHMVFAPSERSPSLPGLRVAGFYSGQHSSLGGTSAAAPQVARWLAEDRLTGEACHWLKPALADQAEPVPPGARCIPPASADDSR